MYKSFLPNYNLKDEFYSKNKGYNLIALIYVNAFRYFSLKSIDIITIEKENDNIVMKTSIATFYIMIENNNPVAVKIFGTPNSGIKSFRDEIWITKSVFGFPVLGVINTSGNNYFETHPSSFVVIINCEQGEQKLYDKNQ